MFGELGTVTVILNVIQLYSSYEIASRITLTLCTHVRYVVKSSVFFKFACVWHIRVCKLTTLHYRQIRGDMIEVYKIVSGKYDSAITPTLIISDTHRTRGNDLRLQKSRLKYDMRKFYFTNRVVNQWNSLPNWVITASNTKIFKNELISIGNIRILYLIFEHK